jgi:N-acetylmuramoyl-L-alanine amidase
MPKRMILRVLAGLPVAFLVFVATVAPVHSTTVKVSVDVSAESTRLVLTHSDPVSHVIQSSRHKITILYTKPVQLDPPETRLDGPIFDRLRQSDPHEIVVQTGSKYDRFESFELRNPYRLILDLKGRPERRSSRFRKRQAPEPLPDTIVVIDPGHGGVEEGAIGPSGLKEKDVTLALARRLRLALTDAGSGISVVLTRDEDRAVGLDERTGVANHNRADLFLSIHVNASPRAAAWGAETYYLSTDATDDEARLLAAQENRNAGGSRSGDKGGALDLVLWDLAQNHHLAESSALAESVQRHLNGLAGTRNRGVRQAPFRVLMGATMPAILVEVGFISNPEEEERLRTSKYLNQIVNAMAAAVSEFLINLERFNGTPPAGAVGPDRP